MESAPAPGSEGAEAALREHLLGGGGGASPAPPSTGGRSTAGSKAGAGGGAGKAWTFASLPFPSPRPAHSAEPDQAGRVKKWGTVAKIFTTPGETPISQIVAYDEQELTRCGVFRITAGTVIAESFTWYQLAWLSLLCAAWALFSYQYNSYRESSAKSEGAKPVITADDIASLTHVTAGLTSLIAFLVGGLTAVNTGRWHKLRIDAVEKFWAAIANMCFRLSIYFPADTPDCELIKETVLRYGLASMQLMFMECRQLDVWTADSDDPKDIAERKAAGLHDTLGDLEAEGLLTREERRLLEPMSARSQAIIVWIASYFTKLCLEGRLPDPLKDRENFLKECLNGREGIRKTLAKMETQNPFYISHQLSLMVKIYLITLASVSGVAIGLAVYSNTPVHAVAQGMVFIVSTIFVQGVIDVFAKTRNPFGIDAVDYPLKVFQSKMENECRDYFEAGERPPYGTPEYPYAVLPAQLPDLQITSDFLQYQPEGLRKRGA